MKISKKMLIAIVTVVVLAVAAGAVWYLNKPEQGTNLVSEQYTVAGITNAFGANLKMVSLLAPEKDLIDAFDRQYKPFITPELLAEWKADPTKAIGRSTSSPYPDKIEIASVNKVSKKSYVVTGNVIEVANATKGTVTTVSVYPVTLTFTNVDGTWLISALER